ncbi:hypothetical protein [Gulosibacter sp. 10]|uniref:hypothetical protein n=1 Tax=Gulosibacter sp. 10 TaxID=1255570 RepID=UPI00097EAC70|nr:hypothetical protein [Gulosibacter sp. 10]SJM70118.1 peptidylglycine monooxygenase-like protien [Gulosibacter sp. 10]
MTADGEHHYEEIWTPGRAALIDSTDGSLLLELPEPAGGERPWRPTSIALDRGARGTGDIWVADGYGASLVHRFDGEGRHIATFDGSASGLRFDCPHGIMIRDDGAKARVLVADRGNHRIVALNGEGGLVEVFGADHLDSPSAMVNLNGELFVTELFGGIARFDGAGRFVSVLEPRRPRDHREPGWPNRPRPDDADALQAPSLEPGCFNSPHGIAAHEGSLYATEWLIGGRLVRVRPASSRP